MQSRSHAILKIKKGQIELSGNLCFLFYGHLGTGIVTAWVNRDPTENSWYLMRFSEIWPDDHDMKLAMPIMGLFQLTKEKRFA